MNKLCRNQIHLWLVFSEDWRDARLLEQYRSLLSATELTQEKRFYFVADQERYLVTRALVRTTLSQYAAVAPRDWSFVNNDHGRPEITNDDPNARRMSFSISHTRGLIALGLTAQRALGVDVEDLSGRDAPLQIADRFFAPVEVAALNSLPEAAQRQRFLQYWTLKESYIKARGMGLSIPLDQFGFDFIEPAGVSLSIDPRLNDQAARWQFWQFQPYAAGLAAVCAEKQAGPDPELIVRRTVPLQGEETFPHALLRTGNLAA
jgi:4'-phosphopantetheinyl transferase